MTQARPDRSRRRRRRRRFLKWSALSLGGFLLLAVLGLPWWLATSPAQRFLLRRANEALAPGGLHFTSFSSSWFGPVEMTNFTLIDPQGDTVLKAVRAVWDRPLGRILFDRPRYGTLTLLGAQLDVERLPDGSIDLHEAVRAILKPNPEFALTIKIERGMLRFRSEGLAEPLTSDLADITLEVPPAPDAITWRIDLNQQAAEITPRRLEVGGSFDRWRAQPGELPRLEVSLDGRHWPIALSRSDLVYHTQYDGTARIERTAGQWSSRGEAALLNLDAVGPSLQGDHPHLDRIDASWDVRRNVSGLSARRVSIKSALGHFEASGDLTNLSARNAHLEGQLDLASVLNLLPKTLFVRDGLVLEKGSLKFAIHPNPGRDSAWQASAKVSDLLAHVDAQALRMDSPAEFSANFATDPDGSSRVESVSVVSPFLKATARGGPEQLITMSGDLDLAGIKAAFSEWLRLDGVELAGVGHLEGTYQPKANLFSSKLQASIANLNVQGIRPSEFQFEVGCNGPATSSGWPTDWNLLTLKGSGARGTTLSLQASQEGKGGGIAISGLASTSLSTTSPDATVATSTLSGRWSNRVLDLASATIEIMSADRKNLRLQGKGRLDTKLGTFELQPVGSNSSLTLTGDGLRVSGLVGGGPWVVELGLSGDMSELDRVVSSNLLGSSPQGIDGTWSAQVLARGDREHGDRFGGKFDWSQDKKPRAALAWQMERAPGADRLDLSEFVISGPVGNVSASGRLDDLWGSRRLDLRGSVAPDWEVLNKMLTARAGADAHIEGKSRSFRLSGSLATDSIAQLAKQLDGEIGVDLTTAKLYGLTLGPMPLGLRARAGGIELIPIDTTVNGGKLRVEAGLEIDSKGRAAIRVKPDSYVRDANINDDVSRTFLAFAAPILADATRVKGLVDVGVRDGWFPLSNHPELNVIFEGSVVFRDVAFGPGPFADELLVIVAPNRIPRITLDEPVYLSIRDGKVHQRGLAIPIGGLSRIELEGWVGFDRTMALTASLPVTSALLGNQMLLADIAAGTTVKVPLRGTLSQPEIDREVLAIHMKDLAKTLLKRGAMRGAAELLMRRARTKEEPKSRP